jgi:hypothetical protein
VSYLTGTRRIGRRVLRGIGRTLAALIGLIAVLGLGGAVYESSPDTDGIVLQQTLWQGQNVVP